MIQTLERQASTYSIPSAEGHLQKRKQQQQRHVSFNEAQNQFFSDSHRRTQVDCTSTWWKEQDYQRFRTSTNVIVKTIVHGETLKLQQQRRNSLENNTHAPAEEETSSCCLHVWRQAYQSCCEMEYEINDSSDVLSQEELAQFNTLFNQVGAESRVGLWNRVLTEISRDIYHRRSCLLQDISELQLEQHEQQHNNDNELDDESEEMYQCSLEASRPARLLAQLSAQAQWFARDNDDE